MTALSIVLLVIAVIAVAGAIVAVAAWAKARERAARAEAVNRDLSEQLSHAYELPQVASQLGVPNQVALVYNPSKAASEEALPIVSQACALFGLDEPKFYQTDPDDSGLAAVQQAVLDGAQLVLVAGGDGTVRAAAKVLVNTDVQLAIIPTGTGNLLARNLELPINDVQACTYIAFNGQVRPIDVISLDMLHDDGSWHGYVSTVIAGAGFDAEIMHSTSDRLKAAAGWLAYTEAGMRNLRGKRHTVTITTADGESKRFRVRSAMIANCGILTGGINMLPEAVIDDGLLDVALLDPRNLVDWMQVASSVLIPKQKIRRVTSFAVRNCKLEFDEPLVTQIDGDPIPATTEIVAKTIPRALKVRVPVTRPTENAKPSEDTEHSTPSSPVFSSGDE
ncbi:MAG TPA: diacylglycerol kinase family protein [Yaniella sp.]